MAQILQTNTELEIVNSDFTLITSYSGEVNPNVTFTYTLTVLDSNSNVVVSATVTLAGDNYTTDENGQISVDLPRGDYVANISKTGYVSNSDTFTILDTNVSNTVQISSIGSFDESFDESFD